MAAEDARSGMGLPRQSLAAPRRSGGREGAARSGWIRLAVGLVFLAAALLAARTLPLRPLEQLERALAPAAVPWMQAGSP